MALFFEVDGVKLMRMPWKNNNGWLQNYSWMYLGKLGNWLPFGAWSVKHKGWACKYIVTQLKRNQAKRIGKFIETYEAINR